MTTTTPTDLHTAILPPVMHTLKNLKGLLAKGQAYANEQGMDDTKLTEFRLAPDMLPLKNQIYIATDVAKFAVTRTVEGLEAPKFDDTETTFDALMARIDKTLAFLGTVPAGALSGKEDLPVTLKTPRGEMHMTGSGYLLGFVVPNVYFHTTTAYNILRHNGVTLGKADFIGPSN